MVFWLFCTITITLWFVVVGFLFFSPLQCCTSANVFRFFFARSQHARDPCTARICSSAIQFNATQTDTNQHHCQLPARCVGKDKTCRYMWAYSFCLCYQFLIEASNFKLYTYSSSVELYIFLYFFIPSSPFPLCLYPPQFFLARLTVSPWRWRQYFLYSSFSTKVCTVTSQKTVFCRLCAWSFNICTWLQYLNVWKLRFHQ